MYETLYQLGVQHRSMPAPLIPEHCIDVAGGPLRLVVESRNLVADMERLRGTFGDGSTPLDDGGPSVHVFGAEDGLEHLRFDCFDEHPHYHYIRVAEQANIIVRIDENAVGDPAMWTIERLRSRLPEMLTYAGAAELSHQVRSDWAAVEKGIDEVAGLLGRAPEETGSNR